MLRSSLRSVRAQDANIGFSTFDKFFYSPVKNNPADAAKKVAAGMDGACAASGEADVYAFSARLLGLEGRGADGAAVPPCACGSLDGPSGVYLGVPAALSPTLVLSPAFAVTTSEAASKVRGGSISARSSLVIEGEDIVLEELELDGALVVRAVEGAVVRAKGLRVSNAGWAFVP